MNYNGYGFVPLCFQRCCSEARTQRVDGPSPASRVAPSRRYRSDTQPGTTVKAAKEPKNQRNHRNPDVEDVLRGNFLVWKFGWRAGLACA